MKTLLVGVQEQDRELAAAIAGHDFRIYVATTMDEARSSLGAEGLDGIVAGVHFNGGDPFELLRVVKAHSSTAVLPFILVKGHEGRLHPHRYRAIVVACKREGINYIDAAELVRTEGPSSGYARLRKRILDLLN